MSLETKRVALTDVKLADVGTDEPMTFEGYGAYFRNEDSYGDVIAPGAFKATVAEAKASGNWPAMLLQHGGWGADSESLMPVGVWTDMYEDDKGLVVKGKLAPTDRGNEVYALMKMTPRPAINAMSIGYRPKKFTLGTKPGEPRRTLEAVDLVEISLVTFPANGKARVRGVKSDGETPTERDAEAALRDAGFSRKEAKAIIAGGFKTMSQRDAGGVSEIAKLLERNIATLTTPHA